MEVKVLTMAGADTGRVATLDDSIFGITPNDHVIYLDVKQYLANQRQGTHKTKERSEQSGSTRKLKRQKGTGGARAGDINSPLLRGGATVFGPQPRSYRFKLNKQVKDLARRSALTYKARNNEIIVVEDFTFEAPSTKRFIEVCKNLQVENKKTLFLLADANKVVYLSSRNLQRKRVLPALQLNTYTVVDSQVLVLTEGALSELDGMFHKF
ncbi:MAG: 50S ribosomal protein L4 [Candidatus [Bacteroides] periocalifornicus]|jgi:50S ribosomal protein L4|uniref:Large ribosomal subunit protein uL4 n=1 Tax=Candidatus [Bacteroides] periocalifornicus TaxID=1702214 RepID=A0A0Q4B9E8_9BACT|nr:MAG: 50S ribosomal protein L4 [Candidatus [Bacteroides] periocalifornicus]